MTSQLQYQSKNVSDINTCDVLWNSIICWAIIIIYMITSIKTKLFTASSKRNFCHILKNHDKNSKFKQQLHILEKASQIFKLKSPKSIPDSTQHKHIHLFLWISPRTVAYHFSRPIIVFYWDYEAHRHTQ